MFFVYTIASRRESNSRYTNAYSQNILPCFFVEDTTRVCYGNPDLQYRLWQWVWLPDGSLQVHGQRYSQQWYLSRGSSSDQWSVQHMFTKFTVLHCAYQYWIVYLLLSVCMECS